LRSKQKNLEDMCKRFLQQNQKLLEENQTLVKKMEKDSREKERRLE
jgi:Skp family chaperone for outer membrane proteins